MDKTYLFVRTTGIKGTKIFETTRKEAIAYMRSHQEDTIQIGILGGSDYETVKSVYREYAPFCRVKEIGELLG